jgi:predicted O-linked N-acetylglucosamine transferase (SPINDLY family)
VQVTYLGYPNTTGLSAVDYRISDEVADPPGEADRLHSERLARLPRVFLCYRPGPDPGPPAPLPAAQAGVVTFGCFNNFQKLSDRFFDAAARILAAVPRSRLLLKARPLGWAGVARASTATARGAALTWCAPWKASAAVRATSWSAPSSSPRATTFRRSRSSGW